MPKGNSCRPVQPVSASAPCAGRSAMLKRGRAPASRSRGRAATGLFRRYALALLLLVGSVGAPTPALANGTGHVFSVQANQVANEGGRIVFTVEITEADNERYPCFSWEITHGTTDTSDFAPGQALSGMQTIPIFDQTWASVAIDTNDDSPIEPDETFTFTISNVAGSLSSDIPDCTVSPDHYSINTAAASGTGTIRNPFPLRRGEKTAHLGRGPQGGACFVSGQPAVQSAWALFSRTRLGLPPCILPRYSPASIGCRPL